MPSHPRSSFRRPLGRTALALAAASALGPLAVAPAAAATCTWNAAAGNWNAIANWLACAAGNGNPAQSPGGNDTANIGAAGVVTINTGQSVLNLNNAGQINIDAFGLNLVGGGSTANTGVINVGSAVTANLGVSAGHNINNAGGVMNVGVGSVINQFGSTISGGTIATTGTGALVAFNNGNNFLSGVTLNGTLDMATGVGIERITSGLVLNGAINLAQGSILAPQGNQTISGNGSIVFADNNSSNRLNVEVGTLTLGNGITVRGNTGYIGQQAFVGGAAALVNNGTIQADVAGGTITLNIGGGGGVTNNGTLAALNGGTLLLSSNVSNNAGSQILAGAGSTVIQSGVTLNGAININGTGSFQATNSGNNFLDATSFTGTLDLASATGVERITSGLVLNGAVNLAKGSVLAPQGNQTISGNGSIVFADNNSSNRLNVEVGTLTLGNGVTVRGNTGYIGQQAFVGGAAALVNNGTIQADVAGGTITLNIGGGGGVTNNGTLAALNGGTLLLSSNVSNNAGSQILAGAGSTVIQSGVTLNGAININGTGSFQATNSGNNFLDATSFTGTLDLASATGVERITSGLVLNGAVNLAKGSVLAPQGNQTISGNGSIVFGDNNASNRLNIEVGTLTLGNGITVRGNTGYIGQQNFIGGAAALVNQGTIVADVGGGTITVNVNGTTFNQGTMKATNGGTLLLNTAVDNSGGVLLADVGSTVRMSGMTVTGGTLNSNGTGAFTATASGSNFLNGVTLNGTLDLATSQSVERISAGGMVLNGAINIAKGSILAPQGNQTISGSGNIVFADNNASNRLNVEVGTLTLGSSVTVSGNTGYIGQQNFIGGAAGLNNQGTINADGGGTITINVNGAVVNDGTMRAQSGTLLVQSGLTGTGTLRVDSAGAMNLANGGNTQGTLTMGAAGAALNIGNGNLTINNDYTNVGAGSGNVFNRLAGISGTGQVVAGGNAAQAITGANVSNGNTANATLTINNVRVGATTFGYQIANTGNTGPTLRGAIQTGVNGASLGDTRLSGAGVTAGNYSTGAPGSNSGNLAVTFNAAAAGALAPLNNQVLNLTSNFANIADQKLNIVLGAGAAAYNAAVGSTTPNPVTVANQRIGGSNTAALTVSNTAAAGAFSEDLKTSFGGNAGAATNNAGTINALLAGSNDNATMRVGVNTASAGAQTGTVTLNYQTTGTVNGVANGLGVAGANAPQAVTVNGNVYQMAQTNAGVVPAVVNLGNFRAGAGAQSQTINILNVNAGAPVGFQEGLTAVIGGTGGGATGTGFANAAVGNTGALQLGLAGIAAGANSGTVQVQLQSNGITSSGNNGLGSLNLGAAQTVTVNGAGYVAAAGAIQTPALNFGNVQAGTQVTQNLVIRNTALGPNGYVEDLNASFATGVGTGLGGNLISGVGSLSGILAGANSSGANGAMTVTVNTGSAGVINGGIGVNYFTAGAVNGVANGLGASQVGGESYGVAGTIQAGGNVIDQAKPVVNGVANPALVTVALGNVRVNDVAGQTLTVLNQATGNQQAFLNSSIASNGGPATASGSFNGLAPGASISAPGGIGTPLKVGIDTSVAGARNGSATISHVSDITSFGNCGSSCTLNLASQTVNVSANVYQVAQPTLPANVNLGATRVGGSLLGAVSVTNTLNAPVGFQEGLNASVASSTGVAVSGSPISNLAAGSTDNTSILVGLGAATAGAKSGSVTLGLASNGSTTSGLANKALGNSAPISVTGAVYQTAVLSATTAQPTIDFGIVRVGTGVGSQNITISNVAAVTAGFNDTLKASVSGLSGPLTAVPNGISALIAGGAAGFAAVSLNTGPGNAGIYSQTAHVSSLSQDGVLADVSGGSADVTVKAQINNLANAVFSLASGAGNFSGGGSSYTLNLGNVLQGSLLNSSLSLTNLIAGPADDLRGVFDLSNLAGFFVSGWNATNLAAGATQTGLGLQYSALNLGNFARSITFNGNSFNASQGAFALGPITINILGDVVQSGPGNVPEPGTLALLTAAAVAGWMTRRRPPLARRAA